MTEEKKEDLNEQQAFLSGHEELLKAINQNPDASENTESSEEKPEPVAEEPVVESAKEEAPEVAEKEPVAETVTEEIPEPAAEEEPKVSEEAKEEPAVEAVEEGTPDEAPAAKPEPVAEVSEQDLQPETKKAPQKHSPQHADILKKQALEQQEVKEVLVFFRKYAKPAIIVVVAICAIVLADRFFKSLRLKKETAADTALMEAQGAEDLQKIVDNYGSTPTAPIALMELAREKFNAGQYDEAEELYTRLTKKYGGHELAVQAEFNLITCKEAKGQFEEAHQLYGAFAKGHESSYLAPAAKVGQARCMEALDKLAEAQIIYEDIVVNYPETTWAQVAEANLKALLGKKK
ncbi:MAG: tetratricopeptide repeat protein [Verrucomicrobiota bacterium]